MEIISEISNLPRISRPLFLALGNFDGIHRGHQAILKAVSEKARNEGGSSAALIFNPHPLTALKPDKPVPLLSDLVDRAEIMSKIGIDYMFIAHFSADFAALEPHQFISDILVRKLAVRGIFIGENYRFGREGTGDAALLKEAGEKLGFYTGIQPMVMYKNRKISSSLIRDLIINGAVKEAADYLNYYYFREGIVSRGSGIGQKLVYPTANLPASRELLWPGKGVYLTAVSKVEEDMLYGVTNVGDKPTFNDNDEQSVETHILNFNRSIYGCTMRLCFLEKLRDIRTFPTPCELKKQIDRDIKKGLKLLEFYKLDHNGGRPLQA